LKTEPKAIRRALGLSQNEMHGRLGLADEFGRNCISAFELGMREPPLPVLLRYAQTAWVWVDVLIDDSLELPAKLPGKMRRFWAHPRAHTASSCEWCNHIIRTLNMARGMIHSDGVLAFRFARLPEPVTFWKKYLQKPWR
jgi:transcriptional regulator with XRE-family HTH domain